MPGVCRSSGLRIPSPPRLMTGGYRDGATSPRGRPAEECPAPRYGTTGAGSVWRTIHSCSRFTLSIWW
jgi:hypothetical protein